MSFHLITPGASFPCDDPASLIISGVSADLTEEEVEQLLELILMQILSGQGGTANAVGGECSLKRL